MTALTLYMHPAHLRPG